ncbi:MAG: hypothetical protein AAGI71_06505 [Bacteroidota bacterium]
MVRLRRHRLLAAMGLLLTMGLAAPTVHKAAHVLNERGTTEAHCIAVETPHVVPLACDLCNVHSTLGTLPMLWDEPVHRPHAEDVVRRPALGQSLMFAAGYAVRGPPPGRV